MPDAHNTDQFLRLMKLNRAQVIKELQELKTLMERINAEGYGWQNVIGKPGTSSETQISRRLQLNIG